MQHMLFTLSVACVLGGATAGQIQFHDALDYATGKNPEGGALLDFDHDGDLDLAVSTEDPDKIELLRNQGGGALQHALDLPTGSGTSPEGLAAGDFDNDGEVDLVAALFSANQVQLVWNLGGGSFALGAKHAVQVEPSVIVAADFDDDGFLDAAVNNRVSGTVSVLRNDGQGGFVAAVHHAVGAETRCAAAADLDGVPDAATSNADTNDVSLMRGSGIAGIFLAGTLVLPIGEKPEAPILLVGDLDHNGGADIVAFNVDGDSVSVLLNEHAGPVCQPDLGFAGPGDASLSVCGDALASGGSAGLLLTGAPANSPAWIAGSLGFAPTPLFGGTVVTVPMLFVVPAVTGAAGTLAVPGLPGGGGPLELYVQCAILDASQPAGVALSNAVKLEFLP
jgi:hypothetical protein